MTFVDVHVHLRVFEPTKNAAHVTRKVCGTNDLFSNSSSSKRSRSSFRCFLAPARYLHSHSSERRFHIAVQFGSHSPAPREQRNLLLLYTASLAQGSACSGCPSLGAATLLFVFVFLLQMLCSRPQISAVCYSVMQCGAV